MEKTFLLSIWLFSVRCEHPMILSAQEGEEVNIPCRYDSGYETYPKYLYVGDYGKRTCITSTKTFKETTQKGKYSLWDDTKERVLHVTIRRLTLNDAGTYWCEIDAYTFDPKTEIKLRVHKDGLSLTAPAHLKPPLVTLNRPVSITLQTTTKRQRPSRTTVFSVTESVSSTPLWSTPPEPDVQTVLPSLAGNKLPLAVAAAAAAVLLVCLLVVLYLRLREHRQDGGRVRRAVTPVINTTSTHLNNIYVENESGGQMRELDPPVSSSSSDSMYAAVNRHRGAYTSICHPVAVYTRVAHPMSNSSTSESMMCPQEENICSVSSPSTAASDQQISEDDHLHYSTVSFKTEAATQSSSQVRSATQSAEMYATIRRPKP